MSFLNLSGLQYFYNKYIKTLRQTIGNLSSLNTTDKSSLVGAVNELNEDINNNLSSGTIQSQLTGYDGSASIFRRGNVVIMTYDLGYHARPMTDGIKQIFSIPEGLRPSASLITTQIVSGDNQYIWRFEENGSVTLQSLSDVSGENIWMVGYFIWTTDD